MLFFQRITEGENLVQDIARGRIYCSVDTIPANIYFDRDVQEMIKTEKHLTMDRKAEGLMLPSASLTRAANIEELRNVFRKG
ncbi:hypothetical protein CEXT_114501 [Caerostris extrusa]|uniref:Uncharacterized protein n=1 Tax=Caerostris extrusa TaxID=172846 RepID=A0AAV4MXZ3_CAEEX|nr:hypothetical protein CEXT_114501 [Caerostris extrusa]